MDKRLCITTATPSRTKYILKSSCLNWCGLFLWVIFMTIQSVNLTVPGGDTPRSAFTKVNANFIEIDGELNRLSNEHDSSSIEIDGLKQLSDEYSSKFSNQSHAASRLVGNNIGNLLQMVSSGVGGYGLGCEVTRDLSESEFSNPKSARPSGFYANAANSIEPDYTFAGVIQMPYRGGFGIQLIIRAGNGEAFIRTSRSGGATSYITSRIYQSTDPIIYNTTTASGANVFVSSSGEMQRSTSSERYKDIIADLELDDAAYANAMQLAPIIYRSTADADNPAYHYYSFSAEALGAHDPAFTLWRDTEIVTDDEGNVTEQPLDERVAEGINLNAIVAFLHATNIKQGKLIKDLQDQVNALKPASTQQPTN